MTSKTDALLEIEIVNDNGRRRTIVLEQNPTTKQLFLRQGDTWEHSLEITEQHEFDSFITGARRALGGQFDELTEFEIALMRDMVVVGLRERHDVLRFGAVQHAPVQVAA